MKKKSLKICCVLVVSSGAASGCAASRQPGDSRAEEGTGGVSVTAGVLGTGGWVGAAPTGGVIATGGGWVGTAPMGGSPLGTGGVSVTAGVLGITPTGGWPLGTGGAISDEDSGTDDEDSGIGD